jgi:hypothetical protein
MSKQPEQIVPSAEQVSAGGCLVRLGWILLGNVLLVAAALSIIGSDTFLSLADAVYWALVAGMIGLRYLDVTRLRGQTAMGQPATLAHWRRYSMVLAGLALVGWSIAHLLAWGNAELP